MVNYFGLNMDLLEKAVVLENEASEFGFQWENTEQIMQQIHSECSEIQVHLDQKSCNRQELQEEIGDLLHAVFSLSVFCKFTAQITLEKSVDKFERRFKLVQQLAVEKGLKTLDGQSFSELMKLWNKAKQMAD